MAKYYVVLRGGRGGGKLEKYYVIFEWGYTKMSTLKNEKTHDKGVLTTTFIQLVLI